MYGPGADCCPRQASQLIGFHVLCNEKGTRMHAVSRGLYRSGKGKGVTDKSGLCLFTTGWLRWDAPLTLGKATLTAASIENVLYTIIRSAITCTQHGAKRLFHFFSISLFADCCSFLSLMMMVPGRVPVFLEMHYKYLLSSRLALDQMQRRTCPHGGH